MVPASPAAATRILVVRHGQSTWNADGRWQGHADPPLTELGLAQAGAAGAALAADALELAAVVSSDLVRARQTAEVVASVLGVASVDLEPRLRETVTGEWTGLTRAEIEAAWPGWLAEGRRPPSFEGWDEVADRVCAALGAIHAAHPGQAVLAVSHAGAIRCVEQRLGVVARAAANLGGRWFTVQGDTVTPGDGALLIDPERVVVTAPAES